MKLLTLSEIWIYPIKSLGGIKLSSAKVLEKGLEFDRRWMLVDERNVFMTQRIYPLMALFKLSLKAPQLTIQYKKSVDSIASPTITIDTGAPAVGETFRARVWDDEVDVIEVSPTASKWFSEYLGMTCRLVSFPETNPRAVDVRYKINDEHVSLADAYPFLIIGQAALDLLNHKLKEPLPITRFRPNFVFTGGAPHEEDNWRNFTIGDNKFAGVKLCSRCVLTTVNQDTAEKGTEPLATLATYRKRENKIYFGQNLVALTHGIVKVGDPITLN
jgi:hypothetical protein